MYERLVFPCSWITSFHGFGFNIEVVLFYICMRNFIWVWWCWGSHILFNTMYFHSHILFISKSKKLLCEKLSFACSCIISFHGFWIQSSSSFISDLYEGYYLSFMMLWQPYIMCYSVISCPYDMWVEIQEIHMWTSCNSMLLIH